jgi:hypothetical protein
MAKRRPRYVSNEEEGIGLLAEGSGRMSPFSSPGTQYFILGDGRHRRALGAVRRAAAGPAAPIVTIDPVYASKTTPRTKGRKAALKYRSTNKVAYRGCKAEKYRFDKAALARVDNVVVVAVCSHANVGAFVSRARAAAAPRTRVFALCTTCCGTPGLRRSSERIEGQARWQLLYPAGTSRPAQRPKLRAALARKKAAQVATRKAQARFHRHLARLRARNLGRTAKSRHAPAKRRSRTARKC